MLDGLLLLGILYCVFWCLTVVASQLAAFLGAVAAIVGFTRKIRRGGRQYRPT